MFVARRDITPDITAQKLEPQAIADAVVQLLAQAGHAVTRDQDEALRCIAKASNLARAWCNGEVFVESVSCRGGLAPWQLLRIQKFVDENLATTIRICHLAEHVRRSDSYFYQAFRRSVGRSPHVYITERRIEHAQQMMLHTEQPLSQIALECGFADQPHLTRVFRRNVGISPAAWRKSYCENQTFFERDKQKIVSCGPESSAAGDKD